MTPTHFVTLTFAIVLRSLTLLRAQVYNDIIQECPEEINDYILYSYKVPFGIPDRAIRTTPPDFTIRKSTIAGLGAFSNTFVRKNTWLAEYEGVTFPISVQNRQRDDAYQWTIYAGKTGWEDILKTDALDPTTSNWIRYVNCARNGSELNVWPHWCYNRVFYRTMCDLWPSQELLTYYGPNFADNYQISTDTFPDFQ